MLNLTKFGTIPSQVGGLWLEGWDYGKKITIPADSIDADLTSFPLPVYLNDTNFDFTKCKADGSDIRFTDKNLNMLKFERKEHDNTAEMAVYNVQVPTVSNLTDTEIYMWYGNADAYNTSIEAWRDQTGKQLTYNGNVKLVTGVESGKRVASLDGNGDYFTVPYSSNLVFGSDDFTIEFLVQISSTGVTKYLTAMGDNATVSGSNYQSNILANGKFQFDIYVGSSAYYLTSTTIIADGTLRHISVTRSGSTFKLFVDGVAEDTKSYPYTINDNSVTLAIGGLTTGGGSVLGYLNGICITKGRARYTANFTPPTTFEIDGTDVVFCTNFDTIYDENYVMVQHMGDSLVDATGSGNNGTATGTTVVDTVYGKARSFDGVTDKIATKSITFATNTDFTILMRGLFETKTNGSMPIGYGGGVQSYLWFSGSRFYFVDISGNALMDKPFVIGNLDVLTAIWDSGDTSLFVDGIVNQEQAFATHAGFTIDSLGQAYSNAYYSKGTLSDFRISNIARSDAWIKAESLGLKDDLLTITDL